MNADPADTLMLALWETLSQNYLDKPFPYYLPMWDIVSYSLFYAAKYWVNVLTQIAIDN